MMKLKYTILSLLLTISASASAYTESVSSPEVSSAGEPHRHVQVYAGGGGAVDILSSSSFLTYDVSLAVALYLTPSDLLEVEYLGGTYQTSVLGGCTSIFNSGCPQESGHISTESLLYQHFWEKSFFTKIGGATSQANYSYTSASGSYTQSGYDQNYYAVLGVGNEWHIHHFTLGFDWARLYIPVSNSNYSEVDAGNGSVNYSDLNKRMNSTRLEWLHVYFGANF